MTSRSGARTFTGSPATWRLLTPRGCAVVTHDSERNRQPIELRSTISPLRRSDRQGTYRRPRLGHGFDGDEVLVRCPPHAARRYTRTPRVRALRTAAPRIRRVGRKQISPPRNQAGQLTARHRQQRPIVSVVDQLVEHVEPIPHRLAKYLGQNPVHPVPFPRIEEFRATRSDHAPSDLQNGGTTPFMGPALRRSDALGPTNGTS